MQIKEWLEEQRNRYQKSAKKIFGESEKVLPENEGERIFDILIQKCVERARPTDPL